MTIPELDTREVDELAEMSLKTLYEKNQEIFCAVVSAVYERFQEHAPELDEDSQFEFFTGSLLPTAMLDPPTQRSLRSKDMPKWLCTAIWNYLKDKGKVKGFIQDTFEEAMPIYEAFSRFITIRSFESDDPMPATRAKTILADIELGKRKISLPDRMPNPFND